MGTSIHPMTEPYTAGNGSVAKLGTQPVDVAIMAHQVYLAGVHVVGAFAGSLQLTINCNIVL
jgi:hypothetical protein